MENKRKLGKYLFLLLALIFVLILVYAPKKKAEKINTLTFNNFIEEVNKGHVDSVVIFGYSINGKFKNGKAFTTYKEFGYELTPILLQHKIKFENKYSEESGCSGATVVAFVNVLFFILVVGFIYFMIKGRGQNKFSMRNIGMPANIEIYDSSDAGKKKTFADVAGIDAIRDEVSQVVESMKDPIKFLEIGARVPKGILLVGDSGVGKTLLARAIAGEAGVPFLTVSGSGFVEMFVGVGAGRVRDLFDLAKKHAPCIVFIDEIDALGRQRGAGMGGGNDEREQTLNQLLVAMDGFEENASILVLAATNRPDILDDALLRPGRFDKKIYVPRPDIVGRYEILKVHACGKRIDDSVKLIDVARITSGTTGADLENLLNEAALIAVREGRDRIFMLDVNKAHDKILMGLPRQLKIGSEERKVIAYHEAGHAIATLKTKNAHPLHKVSIIPRGGALGVTQSLPIEDRFLMAKSFIIDNIVILLAGRAAEDVLLGSITTGASNDLERATKLIFEMINNYGMDDDMGLACFSRGSGNPFLGRALAMHEGMSESTQHEIETRVKALMVDFYTRAKDIIILNKELVVRLAETLLTNEELSAKQVDSLLS